MAMFEGPNKIRNIIIADAVLIVVVLGVSYAMGWMPGTGGGTTTPTTTTTPTR
jgi:ABC-type transporter Mla subunit MlaD